MPAASCRSLSGARLTSQKTRRSEWDSVEYLQVEAQSHVPGKSSPRSLSNDGTKVYPTTEQDDGPPQTQGEYAYRYIDVVAPDGISAPMRRARENYSE